MMPARRRNAEEEVRRTDRRWLVIAVVVFAVAVSGVLLLREVYRATAPHPQVTTFLRRAKLYANSLLRQGRLKPRKGQ